jgi:pyridoxine 5-phosphate synthase
VPKLGVNIDHVATLREARKIRFPDPVEAARVCEEAGCDSIVCHLREDRRHIKDDDVRSLRRTVKTRLNLEMSAAEGIVDFACRIKPDQATLVPERRQEITTEGGLAVKGNERRIKAVVARLKKGGIDVSLFINPSKAEIEASADVGAEIIELHTGEYANAKSASGRRRKFEVLRRAAEHALSLGLEVNAGHGLDYLNTKEVAAIRGVNELNIGHSIISRAIFVGLPQAVREMLEIIR